VSTDDNGVWYDWPLILGYHSVSVHRRDALAVRTSEFESQIAWLRAHGYRSMTLAQYLAEPVAHGERVVIPTFDDGYLDNYTDAFPILKRHGFVGTFFVVSDYVGSDHVFYWDEKKIESGGGKEWYGLMTWEHVLEMEAHGMEIGSHTCTHPELTKVPVDRCREEVERSRHDLGRRLGREIGSFCYPRGYLDDAVIRCVAAAGYSCAVVSPERHGIPLGAYTLRRIGVHQGNTKTTFRLKTMRSVRRNHERLMRLKR
jgi:peptidoglycan/xylan/chitin deacetylase (PgdA/CDA1 family)